MISETFESSFDLIVIGAGINGAGIARDASMRGLRVLLLDKGDIGGGTSSWSTRLIHGGLRYLEHAEFGLVRESLRERECLLKIASHLIRPIEMMVPVYEGARRGRWTLRAGMIAYDALSFDKTLPHHRMLSRSQTLAQTPAMNPHGLKGAAVYYDAQVEFAERLVFENVLAAAEHGAVIRTYAKVTRFINDGSAVNGVEYTGQLDGKSLSARASVIINAAGPWVDRLLQLSSSNSERLIGGTKGSHIIVAAFHGAPANAIYVEAASDQRPFFIIPWNGKYLIGTTDIRFEGDLDDVRTTATETDYLLHETSRVFPSADLGREQVLYSYSGVRPLPFTRNQKEQSITRRHFIRRHPKLSNLLSIVGGKLTTYRSLAEETVDKVFEIQGKTPISSTTASTPLPGASTSDFASFSPEFIPEAIANRLLHIYGTRASSILKVVESEPSLAQVFDPETGAIAAEVVFAFKTEMAMTLADCFLRRTMVGLNSTCGLNAIEAAGRIVREHLGWSAQRVDEEVNAYRKSVHRFQSVPEPEW